MSPYLFVLALKPALDHSNVTTLIIQRNVMPAKIVFLLIHNLCSSIYLFHFIHIIFLLSISI